MNRVAHDERFARVGMYKYTRLKV